jgi:P pilus assembly chaperone PapD
MFFKIQKMKNLFILISFNRQIKKILPGIFLMGVLLLCTASAQAQGNLLLFPKRVIFEGAGKIQTINLINTGTDTVKYLITMVQFRMKEDGSFETISQPDSAQQFADHFLRFFPRHVVLPPNRSQSVKIQLININELQPGEYRSHIYFRAEPDKKPLGEESAVKDTTAIAVRVVTVFGISLPVIIRVGQSTTQLSISNTQLETINDSLVQLKMAINRTGNMSVYGDIAVDHISEQGKITRMGVIKGMALYTPYPKRNFSVSLTKNNGLNFRKGRLHITYTTQPDAKSVLLAETDLLLN